MYIEKKLERKIKKTTYDKLNAFDNKLFLLQRSHSMDAMAEGESEDNFLGQILAS